MSTITDILLKMWCPRMTGTYLVIRQTNNESYKDSKFIRNKRKINGVWCRSNRLRSVLRRHCLILLGFSERGHYCACSRTWQHFPKKSIWQYHKFIARGWEGYQADCCMRWMLKWGIFYPKSNIIVGDRADRRRVIIQASVQKML